MTQPDRRRGETWIDRRPRRKDQLRHQIKQLTKVNAGLTRQLGDAQTRIAELEAQLAASAAPVHPLRHRDGGPT
jgi:septal ring factor EnvC (AmiA/AmiB activator)